MSGTGGVLDANLNTVVAAIGAVGALGTAASGLVDATKAFAGGISNVGFGYVLTALKPFDAALNSTDHNWQKVIRAGWINGASKDDQKTNAKSLIRLGLSSANAATMAPAGHVDPAALQGAMKAVEDGTSLTPDQINVLARFNAAIDAAMDGGFERADQAYRNAAKLTAGIFAVGLSLWGGAILHAGADYWGSIDCGKALLVGLISVPLAPVAKDLTSSLQAAVTSLKAVKA